MKEVMRWDYKSPDGASYGHVIRLEQTGSNSNDPVKKQIIPFFNPDGARGIPNGFSGANRIYGANTITGQFDPVFITEGEKCAFALQGLGFQAVTSLGGSNQVQLADWSILRGMAEIYILPDNDKPGTDYAQKVYQALRPVVGKTDVNILRFPLREKADIYDYLKTLPELTSWNELDSLAAHPQRAVIAASFEQYLQDHREPVPANWRFIVTPGRHKLIAANDFCDLKLPKRSLLLGPWLAEASINMVFADRGIGKTFFCLSAAIAIANGDGFIGYEAPAPASVLYLDGEMQAAAMQERFKALGGANTKAELFIYTPDVQDQDSGTPDLGIDTGRSEVNALIEQVEPKVVFIDNISTFIRSGNENEADSWAPVQEWLVQLRKRGIAIVLIHHANKEGKQRGSHKKEDVMDVVIQLKRPDDYIAGEDATRMIVRYTKARHLEAKDTRDSEATLRNESGTLVWTYSEGDSSYIRCVDLLKSKALSYAEIAEELSVSKSTVHRWKTKAQDEGLF